MEQLIMLSPSLSLGIIAFLLSLLPAAFFLWYWYLRRKNQALPPLVVAIAFGAGLLTVPLSFWLESLAEQLWGYASPSTVNYFHGTTLPLATLQDVLLPAFATFVIVALVEEGSRYLVLRFWFRSSKVIDQLFDGIVIGIGVGVGFATLENTLYFWGLFRDGSFDTLVFVFFLRFLISTLAHVSFGGLMGLLLIRRRLEYLSMRRFGAMAFAIPWFLHGLFDWLLAVNLSMYAVLLLVPPMIILAYWAGRPESFVVHLKDGQLLSKGKSPRSKEQKALSKIIGDTDSPWNKNAPWLGQNKAFRRILDVRETYE